jgi:O-antigen ligase
VAALSIAAVLGLAPDWAYQSGGSSRIKSTLRSVNQLQSYLGPVAPVVIWAAFSASFNSFTRVVCAGIALCVIIAMLVTGSRSAMIMVVLALCGVTAYAFMQVRDRPVTAVASVLGLGAALVILAYFLLQVWLFGVDALPSTMRAIARPIVMLQEAQDAEELLGPRAEQFAIVAEEWWKYPLIGIGAGNFKTAFNHEHEVHNSYLGVLIEQGIFALLSVLVFMGCIAHAGLQAVRREHSASTRSLTAVVVLGFLLICTYGMFSFGMRQRTFWLISGLVMSAYMITRRRGHA